MNRSDYPTLSAPSSDFSGAVLTPQIFDDFRAWVTSDKRRWLEEEAERQRMHQIKEWNLELKRRFAHSLSKTVDDLTDQDMIHLNERLFQSWLQVHGVTEREFWEWIG